MADDDTKPGPDFIFADIPVSKERIVAKTAEARVRMTTKAAVQWYIDQFFNPSGMYNKQLGHAGHGHPRP